MNYEETVQQASSLMLLVGPDLLGDVSPQFEFAIRGMLSEDSRLSGLFSNNSMNRYSQAGLGTHSELVDLQGDPLGTSNAYAQGAIRALAGHMTRYIFATGLELCGELGRNPATTGKFISWLSKQELTPALNSDEVVGNELRSIVLASRLTLVDDETTRLALVNLIPESASKIFVFMNGGEVSSVTSGNTLTPRQVVSFIRARHRILVFDDLLGVSSSDNSDSVTTIPVVSHEYFSNLESMASKDVQVIRLTAGIVRVGHDVERGQGQCISVTPQIAKRHLVDGVLTARYAGWYLAVAARELDCDIVLPADISTVKSASTNAYLRPRVWPTLDVRDWDEAKLLGYDKELELYAKVRRIVVPTEALRSVLEARIPEITGKTVVLPWLGNGDLPNGISGLSAKLLEVADGASGDHFNAAGSYAPKKILFVGHDFKFAGELMDLVSVSGGHEIRIEKWVQQNIQDVELSEANSRWADIVVCEFASHNAVWHSWEKRPEQKLFVHFHGYELNSDWIKDVNISNVDAFVFVSEFFRLKAVSQLGWEEARTVVIPNMIDGADLSRVKLPDSRYHLGIAGIVPILKRPDRALDILEYLLEIDGRYTLHIRGRNPWDYEWMWSDERVRDAYEAFYERLIMSPRLRSRVSFEGFGPDMGRWFQKIGWTLSPSTRETFHLAPIEGMASGAIPVVWDREGATEIFDAKWVHSDAKQAADYIALINAEEESYYAGQVEAQIVARAYDISVVSKKWIELLFESDTHHGEHPTELITVDRMETIFSQRQDATRFGWLIRTLIRDGNECRLDEIIELHPDLFASLPYEKFGSLIMGRGLRRILDSPWAIRARSQGPVYLPVRDSILGVSDLDPSVPANGSTSRWMRCTLASTLSDMRSTSDLAPLDGIASSTGRVETLVLVSADAIIRSARLQRPATIVGQGSAWACLSALVAARRLGVPFVLDWTGLTDDYLADVNERLFEEADLVLMENGQSVDTAAAHTHFKASVSLVEQRSLASLRVGLIADQFTTRTVSESFIAIPLRRSDGYLQVAAENLDAIFVESAWEGPNDEWRRGVAYHPDRIVDLKRIIDVARLKQIPVIFWNKEDPVHFHNFKGTAALMDYVFTTDGDRVADYLSLPNSSVRLAASIPFYAQPSIHNPLNHDRSYDHSVAYAGTYYGDRFKERSIELHRILDAAAVHGLTIYDRQVNVPDSPYHFPMELEKFVREGVPYDEVLKVYKSHPVSINVNSAQNSPTMFSRRVVEIAASGGVVLSGKGRGVTEQIGGIIATDDSAIWRSKLQLWMTNEDARISEAWSQLRCIARSHLADQALTLMFRTAGIPLSYEGLPSYAIEIDKLSTAIVDEILAQTWRPESVVVRAALADATANRLLEAQISVVHNRADLKPSTVWIADDVPIGMPTYFEDILHGHRFGNWSAIQGIEWNGSMGTGGTLAKDDYEGVGQFPMVERLSDIGKHSTKMLTWILAPSDR